MFIDRCIERLFSLEFNALNTNFIYACIVISNLYLLLFFLWFVVFQTDAIFSSIRLVSENTLYEI